MRDLALESYVFTVLENQKRLYDYLGEFDWHLDLPGGRLTFNRAARKKALFGFGGKPAREELGQTEPQLIGSVSYDEGTFLWAWANQQSPIPPNLLHGVNRLREEAETQGAELFLHTEPFPLPHERFGQEMAIIAAGFLNTFTYFATRFDGGALYTAIPAPAGMPLAPRTASLVVFTLPVGIQSLTFNHRKAVFAYLGDPQHEDDDGNPIWDIGNERIRIDFDQHDRIADISATLKSGHLHKG